MLKKCLMVGMLVLLGSPAVSVAQQPHPEYLVAGHVSYDNGRPAVNWPVELNVQFVDGLGNIWSGTVNGYTNRNGDYLIWLDPQLLTGESIVAVSVSVNNVNGVVPVSGGTGSNSSPPPGGVSMSNCDLGMID